MSPTTLPLRDSFILNVQTTSLIFSFFCLVFHMCYLFYFTWVCFPVYNLRLKKKSSNSVRFSLSQPFLHLQFSFTGHLLTDAASFLTWRHVKVCLNFSAHSLRIYFLKAENLHQQIVIFTVLLVLKNKALQTFFKRYFICFVCTSVFLFVYTCTPLSMVFTEVRTGIRSPRNWSYRHSWGTLWVLRIEPTSSARARDRS